MDNSTALFEAANLSLTKNAHVKRNINPITNILLDYVVQRTKEVL